MAHHVPDAAVAAALPHFSPVEAMAPEALRALQQARLGE